MKRKCSDQLLARQALVSASSILKFKKYKGEEEKHTESEPTGSSALQNKSKQVIMIRCTKMTNANVIPKFIGSENFHYSGNK